jgi:hypothetical protein
MQHRFLYTAPDPFRNPHRALDVIAFEENRKFFSPVAKRYIAVPDA